MPAPEQAHVTQTDKGLKVLGPDPLQDESTTHRQVGMPPEELHVEATMRSEASKDGKEACVAPNQRYISQQESSIGQCRLPCDSSCDVDLALRKAIQEKALPLMCRGHRKLHP